ncbi:dysbindin domain-containing protein 2 isoform X1 [Vicugna pacos]|uniref:Dysbindin domain-containing protein 2 isoform X1 n=1 Tax=Vicugna pacos TaxID=30538 RepID=A0ABM5BVA1_VICPA
MPPTPTPWLPKLHTGTGWKGGGGERAQGLGPGDSSFGARGRFLSRPTVSALLLHPCQPGCAAPLLAPWRSWLLASVRGRGAAAHPSTRNPPGSGAHPAQCAGRLGGGSVRPEARNRGLLGADMDPNPRAALERQQLRLRERQKFFEDILQPETEFVFPLSHLHLESHRPPIGSISSMEVNVDTLEQVELIDLGDQDGADVFLPCEDPPPTPQTSGMPLCFGHLGPRVDDHPEELSLPMPTPDRTTSRTSSSSSDSSINPHSPNPSDGGADTPLAQSDEEDGGDGGAEPGACS